MVFDLNRHDDSKRFLNREQASIRSVLNNIFTLLFYWAPQGTSGGVMVSKVD